MTGAARLEWTQTLDASITAAGVKAVFAQTRTRLHALSLRLDDDRLVELDPAWVSVNRWDVPIPLGEGARVRIAVRFSGEHPALTRVEWYQADPGPHDELPGPATLAPYLLATADLQWSAQALFAQPLVVPTHALHAGPQGVGPALDACDSLDQGGLREQRRRAALLRHAVSAFFADLDRATSPDTTSPRLQQSVDEVRTFLVKRLQRRAYWTRPQVTTRKVPRWGQLPPAPQACHAKDAPDQARLVDIADLMLTLVDALIARVPPDERPITCDGSPLSDEQLVAWAFELFVSGRLAVVHPTAHVQDRMLYQGAMPPSAAGVPDGRFLFHFAELALLCLDNPEVCDTRRWKALLPGFVRGAHLVVSWPDQLLHQLGGSTRGFDYYDGMSMPMTYIGELRDAYDEVLADAPGKTALLRDLFSELVGRCWTGNLPTRVWCHDRVEVSQAPAQLLDWTPRKAVRSDEHFKRNLDRLLEGPGVCGGDMCELTGIPPLRLTHLRTGLAQPSLGELRRLAQALDVSLDELVGTLTTTG